MGQFDSYIDRDKNPPPRAMRAFQALIVVGFVVRAVHRPNFETVLAAVLITAIMLPALAGPAVLQRVSRWERTHPASETFIAFGVIGGGLFLLLRSGLSRVPSAEIAVPVGAALAVGSFLWRRRRSQATTIRS